MTDQASGRSSWLVSVISVVIVVELAALLFFTIGTLHNPILDSFGFRQTQTAINVYWMLRDGASIEYLTPVLGAPWPIQFEFPVYQLLVACLVRLSRLDLDAGGRIVSVLFFCGSVWCSHAFIHDLFPDERYASRLFLMFALASPLLVFWARTFMIETCALFFGTAWLLCVTRGTSRRSLPLLLLAAPLCVLAALAKVTTWPAFIVAYLALLTSLFVRGQRPDATVLVAAFAGIFLTVLVYIAWTWHTDRIKSVSLLGSYLTSTSLWAWNFGTWSQRFGAALWLDVLPRRILPETLGYGWPVLLLCVRHVRTRSPLTICALICIALFFLPIAIFTNLHLWHGYYQVAIALFAAAAIAFLVTELVTLGRRIVAAVVCAGLLLGAAARFAGNEWVAATHPNEAMPVYVAARQAAAATPANSTLIVFGIDWSSEVHYYAGRKGLALPVWATAQETKAMLDDPTAHMGSLPIGAVVDCRSVGRPYTPEIDQLVSAFLDAWSRRASVVSAGETQRSCTVLVAPS